MKAFLLLIGLMTATIAAACGGGNAQTEPVAIVNDEEITQEQFERRVTAISDLYRQEGMPVDDKTIAELREQTLQEMINERLFLQQAGVEGISENSDGVQRQLGEITAQFESEAALDRELERQGMTRDDLTDLLIQQTLLRATVEEHVQDEEPSEGELREMYERFAEVEEELPSFEEARPLLREQVLNDRREELAQAFLDELRAEADIEVLL